MHNAVFLENKLPRHTVLTDSDGNYWRVVSLPPDMPLTEPAHSDWKKMEGTLCRKLNQWEPPYADDIFNEYLDWADDAK